MSARRVQVRIARERTGLGDLVAEVSCPGCGTRAEFIGYPAAIEIADGHARCCRPLQDGLTVRICPACQGSGGIRIANILDPGRPVPCPKCYGSGREVAA